MKKSDDQLDFDFAAIEPKADAVASWSERWREDRAAAASRLGLPVGHRIRVEFASGSGLEGILEFDDDSLFAPARREVSIALRIGSARFRACEISTCVRLD